MRVAALSVLIALTAAAPAAARPNLKVRAVTAHAGSVVAGSGVQVTVRTMNAGRKRARRSSTAMYLSRDARRDGSDLRLVRRSVPPLRPRRSAAATFAVPVPALLAAATFRLIACADDARQVRESVERDNCRTAATVLAVQPVPLGPPAPTPTTTPPATATPALTATPTATPTSTPTPPPTPSEQIATAQAAPDGEVTVPVSGVVVTYVKPAVGTEAAGFFIQADQAGPALFVAVDPAGFAAPGNRLSFTITSMDTAGGLRQATAISDVSVVETDVALSALEQEVSAASDLVSALGSYESELLGLTGTITGPFSSAGSLHVAAPLATAGVSDSNLRLRIPESVRAALDLAPDCQIALDQIPMWRFNAVAQPSAYSSDDMQVLSCPAPTVVSAGSLSETSVRVTFSRVMAAAGVLSDGSQFTVDNGLAVTAATVNGDTVTLTTSAQTPLQSYTVSVSPSVTDLYGTPVGSPNSAVFSGHQV